MSDMDNGSEALRGKDIRKGNENLVLRLIQKEGLLSQSEAVEMTGLKAPTILRIFTNLETEGLIQISDVPKETSERKGRKPVFYRLNASALYVIGVEFWALSATVVISNFVREPVYSNTIRIDRDIDGKAVIEKIYELIIDSIKKAAIAAEQVVGIGIGAPGKVDTGTGSVIYYSRIKGLRNLDIAGYISSRAGIPVFVHNNCSVLAMNEYHSRNNDHSDHIFAVLIRSGVGGAYITGGRVLTSGDVTTMEIGHMSVDPQGRDCSCGFKGCLETYLSEEAILSDVAARTSISDIEQLDAMIKQFSSASGNSAESVELKAVLDEKSGVLAYALKNLTHLLSPDLFLVISRSYELSSYLSVRAREILESGTDRSSGHAVRINAVVYDPLHAGMGACDIVFQNYFSGESQLQE